MPRKRILTHQEIAEKAERLIYLIEFSKINRKELCKDTGIKPDTLYRWMSARLQGIGPTGARNLLAKLREFGVNCSEEWLLFGEGKPPFRTSFVVDPSEVQTPPANISGNFSSSESAIAFQTEIDFFHQSHPFAIGTFVADEAMSPVFTRGDYVAGVQSEDWAALFGQFCVVQRKEKGDYLACRLESGSENGTFSLLSLNPTSERPLLLLNQGLIAAARIVWRRSQF